MAVEAIRTANTYKEVTKAESGNKDIARPTGQRVNPVAKNVQLSNDANAQEEKVNGDVKKRELSTKQIQNVINDINNKIRQTKTRCEFTYHDQSNRVSVKIIDRETKEVVKEIPPEETIEIIERIWEIAGILVDEKR